MTLWTRFRSWGGATRGRSQMESEMDAELRFHMEAYAEDLMRGGVQREEAMRRARLEFGGIHCLDAVRRIAPRSAHVPWGDRVRCASAAGKPR